MRALHPDPFPQGSIGAQMLRVYKLVTDAVDADKPARFDVPGSGARDNSGPVSTGQGFGCRR